MNKKNISWNQFGIKKKSITLKYFREINSFVFSENVDLTGKILVRILITRIFLKIAISVNSIYTAALHTKHWNCFTSNSTSNDDCIKVRWNFVCRKRLFQNFISFLLICDIFSSWFTFILKDRFSVSDKDSIWFLMEIRYLNKRIRRCRLPCPSCNLNYQESKRN